MPDSEAASALIVAGITVGGALPHRPHAGHRCTANSGPAIWAIDVCVSGWFGLASIVGV